MPAQTHVGRRQPGRCASHSTQGLRAMLTSVLRRMIILFMILYTTVTALINGTSPLTSTMNMLGYEPVISNNSTALESVVTSLVKNPVKKKSPDVPPPKQIDYVTKHITSCPKVGYFFKREPENSVHASQCYLCFCSDPKWAICWPRENKRCDYEHYHHHGVGKRDVRTRRSPGFSDIFFRDASLDIFNKNAPEQCKPHESSFSDGCPPADWCIGCTVCDCDSNGRWDCHTLSFCPDQEAKKDATKQRKHSKKHFRKNKKKIYKERGLKNATSSKKIISKGKSRTTPKEPSDPKTTSIKSEKKVMSHKKEPQINQPVKKKFKRKNEYQISESKPEKKKFKKRNQFQVSQSKLVKKNTTQVVMTPSKKKREVKKSIKKSGIISKIGSKNNSTILKKNDPKKSNVITKNKSTKIKSDKMIPSKTNQTIKSNLVKKSRPVTKDVTPKNTTEAKANLRQSLRQKPKRSSLSLSAKNIIQTKKPLAKKVNSKNLKDASKEPRTNNKKIQTNKNKNHNQTDHVKREAKYENLASTNPTIELIEKDTVIVNSKKHEYSSKDTLYVPKMNIKSVGKKNNKDKETSEKDKAYVNEKGTYSDMKKKKTLKKKKKKNRDEIETSQKASNLTIDIIKDIEAKRMNRKARKLKKKRSSPESRIQPDVLEGTNNTKRVKRHIYDIDASNSTKFIDTSDADVTKSMISIETVTKPVIDVKMDTNIPINSVTNQPSTVKVNNINGTGKSFFYNNNQNVVSLLTENLITTNSPIQYNKTDLHVATIETTTIMDIEPTVSLSSYYMYSVDNAVQTTSEINKTKIFSSKRSLSESLNLKNTIKDTAFKVLDLSGTSIHTTEPLNVNLLNKNPAQQSASTLKHTEKSKDTVRKLHFGDKESIKSDLTLRLETENLTMQNLKDKRRKIYSSDLTRKLGSTEKKYRLRKIVHVYNRNKTRLNELYSPNYKKKNITNEKISSLQNFIRNHINLFNRRNSTRRFGTHNFKVMSYLKKFFKKILTKQKNSENLLQNDTSSLTINKSKFIKTLCETFGPCYLTQQKQLQINARIDDLTLETNKMFKTIKVLKGLLKLLELDKNNKNKDLSNEDKESFKFSTDVQKLGSILRDNYVEEQKGNLTTTELNQINYVKKNMQYFAQSTANFAKILNEIIDTLTAPGNASALNEKYSKGVKNNIEKRVETFQKLKNLLISYKLLQNRFLQKMYEILGHVYPVQTDKKLSSDIKANKTETLHVYTKNIIKNLRKLKNLAQVALSKTTTHERKRRDIRDDESTEYLLVLMEYLLRRSYHTDSVTDGIDLLIEAIKNAPDIKLVQKEALQKHLVVYNVSNTQLIENDLVNHVKDNNVHKPNKMSKELNNTSKQDDSQANNIDSMDNESDFEYLTVMDRRVNNKITFTTVPNDYTTYTTEQITEDTAILDLASGKTQTESTLSPSSSSLKTILLDEYNKKFDKIMNAGEDDEFEKRMEIFSSDLDDETLTTSTKRPRHKIKYNKVMTGTTKGNTEDDNHHMEETNLVDNLKNNLKDDMSLSTSESKSSNKYLDWLDETFEEEIKEVNNTEKVKPLIQTFPTQEIVLRRRQHKSNQMKDISLSDETYNTKKRDIDFEDKIYNKEMNLLNSLDDNFGKSDSDCLDSKDTFELHTD